MSEPGAAAPARERDTEELRLAMAWNGGVSLAIWMGGVAVEMDAARRASRQDSPDGAGQRMYRAICEAFQVALEIDILCGASAGGLNAALLAAAIQSRRELGSSFVRERWLQTGDFESLLQPIGSTDPPALMQGEKFLGDLREVFDQLLGGSTPLSPNAPADVLLDVQVTDVQGQERCFVDDWHQPFFAREYRAPVRFRKAGDYTPGTLAAAARASASFPGAFEAQELSGRAAHLAGFPDQRRWAIDGGVLENAPIRQAIELIPTRRASGPVKRFVCYVNADPPTEQPTPEDPSAPPLAKVLAYSLTLPRQARLVDQLYALDEARRRGELGGTGVELLRSGPALAEVASVLLPTYRERRGLLSLEALLEAPGGGSSGPGLAERVLEAIGGPGMLPWIPIDLHVPDDPSEWRWGIRAGQRILQLELDVLAHALAATTDPDGEDVLYDARLAISAALAELDGVYHDFVAPENSAAIEAQRLREDDTRRAALVALERLNAGVGEVVLGYVRDATIAFRDALLSLDSVERLKAIPPRESLLGADGRVAVEHFLELALAVEVVRRSFSDDLAIEPGKRLHVAQLTPIEPTLLFSATPLAPLSTQPRVPATPEQKLTGIRFAHFGAFYRRSWRANDFMWGRFDGASHTVRLLVDHERAQALHRRGEAPWKTLAQALARLADEDHCQRELIVEALDEQRRARDTGEDPGDLREELEQQIREDLLGGDGGLTRVLCARAIQCEVFRDEAPVVAAEAELDAAAGAYCTSTGWKATGELWDRVQEARALNERSSLPRELGRDSGDELTSALAARTVSHAAIVGIAALTSAAPLTRLMQPARVPFLAIQGIAARRLLDGVAVVVGFTGAAWYLAARYLTLPRPPNAQKVPLGALWSVNSLVLWVSLLVVLGVVVTPAARAVGSEQLPRKLVQGISAAALAAAGGGVALGWQWCLNGTAVALTSSAASYAPPQWLMWLVAAAGGFHVASQLESVSKVLAPLSVTVCGVVSSAALLVALLGALMAGFTLVGAIAPALDHWGWKTAAAVLALTAPVLLAVYLRIWERQLR
jgi:predicted acylesterase/phospholipase RssA